MFSWYKLTVIRINIFEPAPKFLFFVIFRLEQGSMRYIFFPLIQ